MSKDTDIHKLSVLDRWRDNVDILEDKIPHDMLSTLLIDHTTGKNIIWATDIGHKETDIINNDDIVGINGLVLRPRVRKSEEEKKLRTKKRAEVFTPSWVCNEQLNAADYLWFYNKTAPLSGSPFNKTSGKTWKTASDKVLRSTFLKTKKDWQKYILEDRIEMCCGEGPYLTSRYDVVTEREIPTRERIGILDRKLRVVNVFAGIDSGASKQEWFEWIKKAYQHTYGFEWQGDNLLLTREALLYTFLDNLKEYNVAKALQEQASTRLNTTTVMDLDTDYLDLVDYDYVKQICDIISWNVWQMDGLTGCPPYIKPSIEMKKLVPLINNPRKTNLFGEDLPIEIPLEFCRIMDWDEEKETTYVEVFASAIKNKN